MATLGSVILVIGLVTVLQASTLANTKTIKRLAQDERIRMETNAVRDLIRPIVAEALLQFDTNPRLSLRGEPYTIEFDSTPFRVIAHAADEDVDLDNVQPRSLSILIESMVHER